MDGTEFTALRDNLQVMSHKDLRGGLKMKVSDDPDDPIPAARLRGGIHINENAAALVGRSADAQFLPLIYAIKVQAHGHM